MTALQERIAQPAPRRAPVRRRRRADARRPRGRSRSTTPRGRDRVACLVCGVPSVAPDGERPARVRLLRQPTRSSASRRHCRAAVSATMRGMRSAAPRSPTATPVPSRGVAAAGRLRRRRCAAPDGRDDRDRRAALGRPGARRRLARAVVGADRVLPRLRRRCCSRAARWSTASARAASASVGLAVFASGAVIGALAGSFGVLIASRVVQGVGRRPRQPGVAGRRGLGLPARAARLGARHLGRELRHGEPDRPGRGRPADRRDRLARVLVVLRSGARAAVAWAMRRLVPARRARRREPGCRRAAPAGGGRGRGRRGAHVRRDDRRLLPRPSSTCRSPRATRRSARPRRSPLIARAGGVGAPLAGGLVGLARRGPDRSRRLRAGGTRARGARRSRACRSTGSGALPLLVPFGLGLGMLFVPASRAALNAVPQAKHGRVSSLLSTAGCWAPALGAVLAGAALSGGVTADHMRIALAARRRTLRGDRLAGGGRALAGRRTRATARIERRRPSSRGGDCRLSGRGGEPSRKVRTPQGRVVGSADPGKPEGKCHRNDTA